MSSIPFRELVPFLGGDRGQSFVMSTKTGTTSLSHEKRVAPQIRVDLTRLVEELEFLTDAGAPLEVLKSKLREARFAVMGSASWPSANYASPRHWDASSDLSARVDEAQRQIESRYGALAAR